MHQLTRLMHIGEVGPEAGRHHRPGSRNSKQNYPVFVNETKRIHAERSKRSPAGPPSANYAKERPRALPPFMTGRFRRRRERSKTQKHSTATTTAAMPACAGPMSHRSAWGIKRAAAMKTKRICMAAHVGGSRNTNSTVMHQFDGAYAHWGSRA